MGAKLKGSYTVEASLVMIIVLSVMFAAMTASFELYEEGVTYVNETRPMERDAPEIFRAISWGKELVSDLKGE